MIRIHSSTASRVRAVDGTAANPSIGWQSDDDGSGTGFMHGTDPNTIVWVVNGLRKVTLDVAPDFQLASNVRFGFTSGLDTETSGFDVALVRDSANALALRNPYGVGTAQTFILGQGNTDLTAGRLSMGRDAAAAVAPGAGLGMLRWETGTNANTLKLVAYSGTSTTGVTIVDNVGAGN